VTHCSDDDLVLHYYRDAMAPAEVGGHLAICDDCSGRYRDLAESLQMLAFPDTPEVGGRYGTELWYRIAPRLPEREPFWRVGSRNRASGFARSRNRASGFARWFRPLSLAAAAVVLLVVGFVAGRATPGRGGAVNEVTSAATIDSGEARRVLLMSVADHLERSDRVLTDIINAQAEGDISAEQRWAADLVSANRFYRQDALDSDEHSVAAVLDELERALLDIVHSPSPATQADLDQMHRRLDSAALVFKVRVLGGELRQRQLEPAAVPPSQPSPSRIS
jgi:hypothetical protein